MKRKLLATGLIGSIVLLIGVGYSFYPSRPGVMKGNFDRIGKGMTPAEVTHLFGTPPTDTLATATDHVMAWDGRNGKCVVTFVHDRVTRKEWWDSSPTVLERIRSWLLPSRPKMQ